MRSIRARLLAIVLLAALIPAVPLSLVVRNLLDRSLNPAYQESVATGLEAGLETSRELLRRHKAAFTVSIDRLWRAEPSTSDSLATAGAVVLDSYGLWDRRASLPDSLHNSPPVDGSVLRRGTWLLSGRCTDDGRDVLFGRELPSELVSQATAVTSGLSILRTLELERDAILRSYVLPFLLAYAVLLGVALLAASLAARRLARPLADLAVGAREVGAGNLDTRITTSAGGEIGELADAFNTMTTELEVQRRQLSRLEKMAAWRGMARILAHEIKNPLTPILLAVQETCRSYRGDDERFAATLHECETIVGEEVEGLRDLVRSFSDFARLPRPEPTRENVIDLLEDLSRLYGDGITCEIPSQTLIWEYDAGQLRRALINLVDNGLAACRRDGGGAVRVGVHATATGLRWSVGDDGNGIPDDQQEAVFEPDFTTGDGGMGLGLPIVKGIAEAHGGTVYLESPAGGGTIVTIELPAPARKESSR